MKHGNKIYILLLGALLGTVAVLILTVGLLDHGLVWFVDPVSEGYTIKGVDVSERQGEIDWSLLPGQGIRFAYIGASWGHYYKDPQFDENLRGAQENHIITGAYHYFNQDMSAIGQAQQFLYVTNNYQMELPPVLHFKIIEDGQYDAGTDDRQQIIGQVKVFLETVEESCGVTPVIYTRSGSYHEFLEGNGFERYPLWVYDMLKEPETQNGRVMFWKYSNRGRLQGFPKEARVNMNVFCGSEEQFLLLLNPAEPETPDKGEGRELLQGAQPEQDF